MACAEHISNINLKYGFPVEAFTSMGTCIGGDVNVYIVSCRNDQYGTEMLFSKAKNTPLCKIMLKTYQLQ